MATAVCPPVDGGAAEGVNAEAAAIPGVLAVEADHVVTGDIGDESDREGDRTFV